MTITEHFTVGVFAWCALSLLIGVFAVMMKVPMGKIIHELTILTPVVFLVILLQLPVSGCGNSEQTPDGIGVYNTEERVNPDTLLKIDRQTREVENKLYRFGQPPAIPEELAQNASCRGRKFSLPLRRNKLIVRVAGGSEWKISCRLPDEQVLNIDIPQEYNYICEAKGAQLTPDCPSCQARGTIQADGSIFVTPNLKLYKAMLVQWATSCANPWVEGLGDIAQPD